LPKIRFLKSAGCTTRLQWMDLPIVI